MKQIIDAHAHIIPAINGIKRGVETTAAKYGRIKWNNEEIVFLPPYFKDTTFTLDMLLETMDANGVSKAVLLQNPVLGIINDHIKGAIDLYPDRFAGTIQVDPMDENAISIIKHFASSRQNTIKLEISEEWGWSGNYLDFSLVGKQMMQIWEIVSDQGLNVIIDTGDIFNNGYQIENIKYIAQKFPDTKIVLEHLGFYREVIKDNNEAIKRRIEMLSAAKDFENVFLGFSSTAAFINDEYPCIRTVELLREAVDLVGASKILWGSDIPSTFKKYTYQQMIDVVDKHAAFLSETEKDRILFQNAQHIFF
jgi:predicted TIM-barrel fold metal-dependent hydrolase